MTTNEQWEFMFPRKRWRRRWSNVNGTYAPSRTKVVNPDIRFGTYLYVNSLEGSCLDLFSYRKDWAEDYQDSRYNKWRERYA